MFCTDQSVIDLVKQFKSSKMKDDAINYRDIVQVLTQEVHGWKNRKLKELSDSNHKIAEQKLIIAALENEVKLAVEASSSKSSDFQL